MISWKISMEFSPIHCIAMTRSIKKCHRHFPKRSNFTRVSLPLISHTWQKVFSWILFSNIPWQYMQCEFSRRLRFRLRLKFRFRFRLTLLLIVNIKDHQGDQGYQQLKAQADQHLLMICLSLLQTKLNCIHVPSFGGLITCSFLSWEFIS